MAAKNDRPLSASQIATAIINPANSNLGNLGVAMVAAAKR